MSSVTRQSFPPKRKPTYDERQNAARLAPGIFNEKHDLWDAKLTIGAKGTPAHGRVTGQNDKHAFYVDNSRAPLPPRLVVAPLKQTPNGAVAQWSQAQSRAMSAADIGALTTVIALSEEDFVKDFVSVTSQFQLELGTRHLQGSKLTLSSIDELDKAYGRSIAMLDTINQPETWKHKLPLVDLMALSSIGVGIASAAAVLAATSLTTPLGYAMFAGVGATMTAGLLANGRLPSWPGAGARS